MLGKKKCKILREIRQQIATENDIPFVTEECRYKGDCKGTCTKCESELRYLEAQIEKRRAVGKAVTVSALALSLAAGMGGCGRTLEGDVQVPEGAVPYVETDTSETAEALDGEIAVTEVGKITETQEPEPETLEGDVAYIPEETEETETTVLEGSLVSAPESESTENGG